MSNDAVLREHLLQLLRGGQAHTDFDDAIKDFPTERAGIRPSGLPHSAWELLEHLRIAQQDILRFSQSGEHVSPKWPEGYWPPSPAPENAKQWKASVSAFRADLAAFQELIQNPQSDLYKPFSWGDGQTLLREALLAADHNAYHLGQLVLVRQALGTWPASA